MTSLQRRLVLHSLANPVAGALVARLGRYALCSVAIGPALAATAAAIRWGRPPYLPDLPLLDHDGREIRLQKFLLQARTTLVSFMFTGCGTVCLPQTAVLRETARLLQDRGDARDVLFVSLTVDPLADGPSQLRAYARRFDVALGAQSGWAMVTGTPANMARTLSAFDVPAGPPGDHPSLLWLGDAPRQRWTRTSGLNPPQTLVDLVLESRR